MRRQDYACFIDMLRRRDAMVFQFVCMGMEVDLLLGVLIVILYCAICAPHLATRVLENKSFQRYISEFLGVCMQPPHLD